MFVRQENVELEFLVLQELKLTSNHKQIVESYGQTSFLEKKHFSHLKSKDITEFQNFQLLKYRLGTSIKSTSRNYSNDFFLK